jgi:hypothetical protein
MKRKKKMSYDSDYENIYMVLFKSGKVIYVGQYTLQDVIEYCNVKHPDELIKEIYKEVFNTEYDEEECEE